MLAGVAVAAAIAAGVAWAAAPSTRGQAPAPYVALVVSGIDGAGDTRIARLTCRGTSSAATSFLRPRARTACAAARRLAAFLDAAPPRGRVCTQIYGGRDTARVRGRIGARLVDRRFARTDGCEIADWDRAQVLLYPPLGVGGL